MKLITISFLITILSLLGMLLFQKMVVTFSCKQEFKKSEMSYKGFCVSMGSYTLFFWITAILIAVNIIKLFI